MSEGSDAGGASERGAPGRGRGGGRSRDFAALDEKVVLGFKVVFIRI